MVTKRRTQKRRVQTRKRTQKMRVKRRRTQKRVVKRRRTQMRMKGGADPGMDPGMEPKIDLNALKDMSLADQTAHFEAFLEAAMVKKAQEEGITIEQLGKNIEKEMNADDGKKKKEMGMITHDGKHYLIPEEDIPAYAAGTLKVSVVGDKVMLNRRLLTQVL
jgi:hypothetical protein